MTASPAVVKRRLGFSWRASVLERKGAKTGVGKAWISLDSLVRNRAFSMGYGRFPEKIFSLTLPGREGRRRRSSGRFRSASRLAKPQPRDPVDVISAESLLQSGRAVRQFRTPCIMRPTSRFGKKMSTIRTWTPCKAIRLLRALPRWFSRARGPNPKRLRALCACFHPHEQSQRSPKSILRRS